MTTTTPTPDPFYTRRISFRPITTLAISALVTIHLLAPILIHQIYA